MNINALRRLKVKLLGIKPKYLTVKEIREIMRNGEDMPTAIFNAKKEEYIVKPRTIFGKTRRKSKGRISY